MKLDQLTLGLDRLLARDLSFQDLPPLPDAAQGEPEEESAVMKAVKKMSRKLAGVETMIQRDMRAVSDEVTSVGESLGQHMGQLNDRHDRLEAQLGESRALSQVSFHMLNESLAASSAAIQQQGIQSQEGGGCSGASAAGVSEEVNTCLETLSLHAIQQEENLENLRQETHRSLEEHLVTLQKILLETHAGQTLLNTSIADLTQSLSQVNTSTQGGLTKLASNIQAVQTDSVGAISVLEEKLHEDNTYIKEMLEARAEQMEKLHNTVLKNVGQVMIQTADSVLDTKRSIEFGVQQIILELSEIVRSSGSTINTTLHDQINKISVAILKNQTSALTNMTARMEQEISQVWRQIGIMYQQMIQSVDLLDELKDTTNEHMNASLSRVGNMDGTVGKINSKVIDVENNLNYLLGRLSLVVSEFNLLKNGVGEELMRLRDNLASQNNSPVEFAEGEEPPADSRYDVNRKRDAPLPHNRAGAF
ncbi:hypothetical protein O3P69_015773 [Scylla paramamosain]|uniref:Uncharacterized protein n=1 Tax=Scylla paramamosain TaxID=85552 RepID=A0AAW0T7H2_SCYPA